MNKKLAFSLSICAILVLVVLGVLAFGSSPMFNGSTQEVKSTPPVKEDNTIFERDLTPDEKKQAYDLVFNEVRDNFAAWNDFTREDWIASYDDNLERVLSTDNLYDFYLELKRSVVLLNDDHSRVDFPAWYYTQLWVTPITIAHFSDGYYITHGNSEVCYSKILKIDGMDTDEYMKSKVFPYYWHGKINSSMLKAGIMATVGKPKTSQRYEILTPQGEIKTVYIDRVPYSKYDNEHTNNWKTPGLGIDIVPQEIFEAPEIKICKLGNYIQVFLYGFSDEALVENFRKNLDVLKQSKGIIVDVRYNTGGNPTLGYQIAQDLRECGVPVVTLQHYTCGSAGEYFITYMNFSKRLGTETYGGAGGNYDVMLTGGGNLKVVRVKSLLEGIGDPQNIGVEPDIFVENSIEDYKNGYDRMLDAAIKELQGQ